MTAPASMTPRTASLAVRRVLEIHVQAGQGWAAYCAGCSDACLYCEGDHDWPCPTVVAVYEATGEAPPARPS